MTQRNEIQETTRIDALFEKVSALIEQGRHRVVTAANIAECYTKYGVGKYIVEEEQQGKERAEYGKQVLKVLSARLTERFGDGWSVETLDKCRKFYRVYSSRQISSTMQTKSNIVNGVDEIDTEKAKQRLANSGPGKDISEFGNQSLSTPRFTLSWSHYLVLMRIENPDARNFYEIECAQQQWSVRQLSRQVGSSLYERLALSRDKDLLQAKVREWIAEFKETNGETE